MHSLFLSVPLSLFSLFFFFSFTDRLSGLWFSLVSACVCVCMAVCVVAHVDAFCAFIWHQWRLLLLFTTLMNCEVSMATELHRLAWLPHRGYGAAPGWQVMRPRVRLRPGPDLAPIRRRCSRSGPKSLSQSSASWEDREDLPDHSTDSHKISQTHFPQRATICFVVMNLSSFQKGNMTPNFI